MEMNHFWTIIWLNATFIIIVKFFQVTVFLISPYPIVLTVHVESDTSHDLNGFTRDTAFLRNKLQVQSLAADLELKFDKLEFDNDVNNMFDEFQNLFLEVLTKYAPLFPLRTGGNRSKKPPWLSHRMIIFFS